LEKSLRDRRDAALRGDLRQIEKGERNETNPPAFDRGERLVQREHGLRGSMFRPLAVGDLVIDVGIELGGPREHSAEGVKAGRPARSRSTALYRCFGSRDHAACRSDDANGLDPPIMHACSGRSRAVGD